MITMLRVNSYFLSFFFFLMAQGISRQLILGAFGSKHRLLELNFKILCLRLLKLKNKYEYPKRTTKLSLLS